jgi:hypothetical protein
MSDPLTEHGPGWTLDQTRNRPDVDPVLVDLLRSEAPIDPHAAALLEHVTTPEGYR